MNPQFSQMPIGTAYHVIQVPDSLRLSSNTYTHAEIGRKDGMMAATTISADFAADGVEHEKSERA